MTQSDKKTEGKPETDVNLDVPVMKFVGYSEDNPNHTFDPFAQTGTLDTSDTAGTANNRIESVSPIFDIARAENMKTAARALDPDDPTPSELVVLPQGEVTVTGTVKTAEEGRQDVFRAVEALQENPIEVGGPNEAQREAAEDTSDERSAVDSEGHIVTAEEKAEEDAKRASSTTTEAKAEEKKVESAPVSEVKDDPNSTGAEDTTRTPAAQRAANARAAREKVAAEKKSRSS